MANSTTDTIKNLSEELFTLIGVNANVSVSKTDDEVFEVNIETPEETGLLIGFRGENITALQSILSLMLKNKTGDWHRIVVNVGDYREKQENKLKDLANQVADRVIETGDEQPIYNLNAAQRRIIHMYLAERSDVSTESQGEEPERYLVVKKK